MWWTKWKSKIYIMPTHDRPKRHSVKAVSKTQQAEADAARNKAAEKARKEAHAAAATKKRAIKVTVDDLSDGFSRMHIAGRRHRTTRRKVRRTHRRSRTS
jgi:membrane protein involved in colicin uptake